MIDRYSDQIYRCSRCGNCREKVNPKKGIYGVCPLLEEIGFESNCARGKIQIARALLEGDLPYTQKLADGIYNCTLCGSCKNNCPVEIDTPNIVRAMRTEYVRKVGFPKEYTAAVRNMRRAYNPFTGNELKALKKDGDDPEVAYFAGCSLRYEHPEVLSSTVGLLEKLGVDFAFLDERCCGVPALNIGDAETADSLLEHNIRVIKKSGSGTVLFSCPGCYNMFKNSSIGGVKLQHISEFLNGLDMRLGKYYKTVTYHDPCRLSKTLHITDEPRALIERIPGVKMKEMKRTRENALCCGGGGGYSIGYKDIADRIGKKRVDEAAATGAQVLLTACPTCKHRLVKNAQNKIEVLDISELLYRTLK
jgi:Fe-S oxidoreductase